MKVKEVISVIEDFAPLSIQESWDNSGLVIGSPEQEVHGVLPVSYTHLTLPTTPYV